MESDKIHCQIFADEFAKCLNFAQSSRPNLGAPNKRAKFWKSSSDSAQLSYLQVEQAQPRDFKRGRVYDGLCIDFELVKFLNFFLNTKMLFNPMLTIWNTQQRLISIRPPFINKINQELRYQSGSPLLQKQMDCSTFCILFKPREWKICRNQGE